MESLQEITKDNYKQIREKAKNVYKNKLVKRTSVFETNSSSCHSIVYTGGKVGKVNPNCTYGKGEYGWGYDTVTSPSDKLDYMIIMIGQNFKNNTEIHLQSIINILKKREGKDFVLKIINGDYLDFIGISIEGIEVKEYKGESGYGGYIDHQSDDTLDEVLSGGEESIEKFIYGEAVIIISNDNE